MDYPPTDRPHPPAPAEGSGSPKPPTAEMVALLYDELRSLAGSYFARQPSKHTLQPTALVHEAFMKLYREEEGEGNRWRSSSHFLAVAAKAMRQILVDHARAKGSLKRGRNAGVTLDMSLLPDAGTEVDVLELNEVIDRLAAKDERASKVVVLRFFAGLSIAETAAVLGVSDFTVEKDWRVARAWLAREFRREGPDAEATP
ncbi:MAG: hypothetical protein AMXMBFR58_27420 [Phycisphaerae bacterium]